MSIKVKQVLLMVGFSLIVVFMFASTVMVSGEMAHDGLVINLAGRQRMLSQKISKEVLAFAQNPSRKNAATIENTAKVFDLTLAALTDSGEAPLSLNLGSTAYRHCPAATGAVRSQLLEVASIWKPFYGHLKTITSSGGNTEASQGWVMANNLKLLTTMNKAVVLMQKASEKKLSRLYSLQIGGIVAGLVMMVLGIRSVVSMLGRLEKVKRFSEKLGSGELNTTSGIEGGDELGHIGKSLDAMAKEMRVMISGVVTNSETLHGSSSTLGTLSTRMSDRLSSVAGKSQSVAASAEQMNSNMNSVAAAIEEASTNVGMVAGSAEQMMSTINDIVSNTEKATRITSDAVVKTESSAARISSLGSAADAIGHVTESITEISEQTNLLALNATIEAARAGDAGKGFAVVANEIKELARQTAEATGDIRSKVQMIQEATRDAVSEMGGISDVVGGVNDVVSGISSAVEEQSVTTREITENIGQASLGIQEVAENIADTSLAVSSVTQEISALNQETLEINDGSSRVASESTSINSISKDLVSSVSQFSM